MIAAYLAALERKLRTRGRARRRFLAECRAHLADLASEVGETEAVRAFGEPAAAAVTMFAAGAGLTGLTASWSGRSRRRWCS